MTAPNSLVYWTQNDALQYAMSMQPIPTTQAAVAVTTTAATGVGVGTLTTAQVGVVGNMPLLTVGTAGTSAPAFGGAVCAAGGGTGTAAPTAGAVAIAQGASSPFTFVSPGAVGTVLASDGVNWGVSGPLLRRYDFTVSTAATLNAIGTTWSTGYSVIAAQGAGTIIIPHMLVCKTSGTPLTNATANMRMALGSAGGSITIAGSATSWCTGNPGVFWQTWSSNADYAADAENSALKLTWQATQTGGDATTSGAFTLFYYVV